MAQNLVLSRRSRSLRCEGRNFRRFSNPNRSGRQMPDGAPLAFARTRETAPSDRDCLSWRQGGVHVLNGFARELARLRTVIVTQMHSRPRLDRDRDQAIIERLGGNRLDEIFVYA